MLLKIAAIAALCVTDAVAQVRNENCVTENGDMPFMYCVESVGTTLFWNYTMGEPNVLFAFEAPEGAWRAVGFSSTAPADRPMVPANAVFGCTDMVLDAESADYELSERSGAGVVQAGNQGLLNYNQVVEGGICTVRFDRPANINIELQMLGNRPQTVIFAQGGANQAIQQHPNAAAGGRSAMVINFAMPMGEPGPDMTMPPPDMTMPDNVASSHSAPVTLLLVIVGSIFVALW